MVTPEGGKTEEVRLNWSLQTLPEERLLTAVKSAIAGSGCYQKVYGPLGKSPIARVWLAGVGAIPALTPKVPPPPSSKGYLRVVKEFSASI